MVPSAAAHLVGLVESSPEILGVGLMVMITEAVSDGQAFAAGLVMVFIATSLYTPAFAAVVLFTVKVAPGDAAPNGGENQVYVICG
jgi:hypothetical protein